jgi:AcrR family transcriptional regulator
MSRGKKRPVAGREEMVAAARAIGIRDGWKAVTIRAVANDLGYRSPVLYEHFRDKEELLTQIAVRAICMLERRLSEELPADAGARALQMVERYWTFMLEHRQLYRLMNGMDGVPVDREIVNQAARGLCELVAGAAQPLVEDGTDPRILADELWALLHGMAALTMDRLAAFDLERVKQAAMRLVDGTV